MMTLTEAVDLSYQYGSQTTITERLSLVEMVIQSPKGDIVEVGSASGGTTILLSFAAEIAKKYVYSIDPYPEILESTATHYKDGDMKYYRNAFKENILDKRANVTQYNADLAESIDDLPELSLAFIDGLHEFDSVKKELALLYPLIVPGGIICLHDTGWEKGQGSGVEAGAVCRVLDFMSKDKFKEVKSVGANMVYGVKA